MRCSKSVLISAYLDEELQGTDRTALESHLQGCTQCVAALQEMLSLRAAFAKAERHPAPCGFATRVMAHAVALERKKSPWFVPLLIRFAEVAVLLVVITVGILAGKVMTNRSSAAKSMSIASSLSLDLFDAAPPGSLGGAYLAMTEVRNEK